mgnify:CR=1 FL=1
MPKNILFEKQQNFEWLDKKYRLCREHNLEILYYSNYIPSGTYISEVYNNKTKLINKIKNTNN